MANGFDAKSCGLPYNVETSMPVAVAFLQNTEPNFVVHDIYIVPIYFYQLHQNLKVDYMSSMMLFRAHYPTSLKIIFLKV